MSARSKGRSAWLWWWMLFAAALGVPPIQCGDLLLIDLERLRKRRSS